MKKKMTGEISKIDGKIWWRKISGNFNEKIQKIQKRNHREFFLNGRGKISKNK